MCKPAPCLRRVPSSRIGSSEIVADARNGWSSDYNRPPDPSPLHLPPVVPLGPDMRTIALVAVLLSLSAVCLCANSSEEPVPVDRGRVREMSELKGRYGPKPEIRHTFREPEKRPAALVSDTFTVLVILPFLMLLVLWAVIGVNVSGFSPGLANIGFHSGIALILSLLFSVFWNNMDMFLTLKCLSGVLLMTFLSGHCLLKGFAKKRQLDLS